MPFPQSEKKYSYADYLVWDEDVLCEVIDGGISSMSPSPTNGEKQSYREAGQLR